MNNAIFITGTDTGVGKTWVSTLLLDALNQSGSRAVGMKPVASGCRETSAGLRNADAEQLLAHSAGFLDYSLINPYPFKDAVAPHIAAATDGIVVSLDRLQHNYTRLREQADIVVVEGVGGWAVPLTATLMQADLVRALNLPVLLVVGIRLGCINHALLTAQTIQREGFQLAGWIGNCIDPTMLRCAENIDTLRQKLVAPCLGILPHIADNAESQSLTQALSKVSAYLLG